MYKFLFVSAVYLKGAYLYHYCSGYSKIHRTMNRNTYSLNMLVKTRSVSKKH